MLLIDCPHCGPRAEPEFQYAGEAHIDRPGDPAALSDEAWATHLFYRSNTRGLHAERWRHTHGCGRYFNAVRDTVTDRFIRTYPTGTRRPDVADGTGEIR